VGKIVGVIPARLKSERLPEKMLRMIHGKPLIQWTYENALKVNCLSDVLIACDSPEIQAAVRAFGGKVRMTDPGHLSGTARIAEVAASLEADVIVNIQGDEPLMSSEAIEKVAQGLFEDDAFAVSTAAVFQDQPLEYENPNVVKVVFGRDGAALYFSRAPIPFYRDGGFKGYWKHLGLYAYRRQFLVEDWEGLKPSQLELQEKLEQLRILDNGFKIKVLTVEHDAVGVDTEDDLKTVETILGEG